MKVHVWIFESVLTCNASLFVSLYLKKRSYIHVHFACILGYKLMCECDYISANKNSAVYVFIPVF